MEEQEISLKDLLKIVKEYFQELKSKLKWVFFFGIICAFLFSFQAITKKPEYIAQLTFMMDESQNGSRGGEFGGLQMLGSLFGGNKGNESLGKILQLFESKKIVHNTLFDSIEINGKNDFLANHFLDLYTVEKLVKDYKYLGIYPYKQTWPKRLLENTKFKFTHGDVDDFRPIENLYLRIMYEAISGNKVVGLDPKLRSSLDETTGIMTVIMSSDYEDVTLGVLNNIYAHLSDFFIEKSTEKQRKTLNIMTFKRDSIIGELKSKEYALANFKDSNRKLVTVKGYLQQLRLEREVGILNIMYGEVVKQLEMTDFTLRNMTPVVQIIDLPRRPLYPFKPSWFKNAFLGFAIGAFLCILYVLGKKGIKDLLKNI